MIFQRYKLARMLVLALMFIGILLVPMGSAFAQSSSESSDAGLASGIFILLCVGISLVINIAIIAFVWVDANRRGANGVIWAILVFLFGIFALLAYFVMRPQGKLIPCPNCNKLKPITSQLCPHCGRTAALT
jgi:uncharacterized membrane protein YhaH (DUF805 family)